MGIVIKTLLDQRSTDYKVNVDDFTQKFFPQASHFMEDVAIFKDFFKALVNGLKTLGSEVDKDLWVSANSNLQATIYLSP